MKAAIAFGVLIWAAYFMGGGNLAMLIMALFILGMLLCD